MKRLLIAVALREECKIIKSLMTAKSLLKESPGPVWRGDLAGFPVDVIVTEMGPVASHRNADRETDPAIYGGVLILGFCGGLSLTLKTGDAVVATKLMTTIDGQPPIVADIDLCEALGKAQIAEGLNYRAVPLLTHNRVIETTAEKAGYFEKLKTEAVDMESYAIATVAREKHLPWAALKVVADDSETELPNFNDYLDHEGKLDQIAFRQVLMNHPTLAMSLSKFMKIARMTLEKGAPSVIPVVCRKWNIEKTV